MTAITRGHDSEFGLLKDGVLISALDVYDMNVEEYPEGRVFADNMNVELAINPVTTLSEFHSHTEALLSRIKDRGFDLHPGPMLEYPASALDHPMARVAGCMPDMSAYTLEQNEPPDFETLDAAVRTTGAHMHAQLDGARPDWYARWMDALVTLPLLIREEPSDRRTMYGAPGCYRPKDYGGEYRTLSSFWVQDPELREYVWTATHKAVELSHTTDPDEVDQWWDIPTAIARHDLTLARSCYDRLYIYGLEVL